MSGELSIDHSSSAVMVRLITPVVSPSAVFKGNFVSLCVGLHEGSGARLCDLKLLHELLQCEICSVLNIDILFAGTRQAENFNIGFVNKLLAIEDLVLDVVRGVAVLAVTNNILVLGGLVASDRNIRNLDGCQCVFSEVECLRSDSEKSPFGLGKEEYLRRRRRRLLTQS